MRPWLISSLTLFADQFTKYLVVASFSPGESRPLIPPIADLTYVQNTGAAFGLFKGQQVLFIGFSLLVIAWIARAFLRGQSLSTATCRGYALILGGAVGNLIDRLRVGYVVDFINFHVWPVFNVGDSAITIGVTLLIAHAYFIHGRR
jgi:signal peptidase II